MAFRDDVNEYCNPVDGDDLSPYISAAETYLTNAGVTAAESNSLYALAVKMLVSQWYDTRTPDPSEKNLPQPYGLSGIILQLQLAQEATD
jgi:hypothetical protein